MVRFGRTDGNQKPIVRILRKTPGISVRVLSDVGGGMTDIIVGRMNKNFLIELKYGSDLTPAQKIFHGKTEDRSEEWLGQKAIANSIEDVWDIIGVHKF